jgi:hypothetical protein
MGRGRTMADSCRGQLRRRRRRRRKRSGREIWVTARKRGGGRGR